MAAAEYLAGAPRDPARRRSASASRPTRRSGTGRDDLRRRALRRRLRLHDRRRRARRAEDGDLLGRRRDRHLPRLQHPPRLREGRDGQRDQASRPTFLAALPPRRSRRRRPTGTRASSTPTRSRAPSARRRSSCSCATSTTAGLREQRRAARSGSPREVVAAEPRARVEVEVKASYRNMRDVLDRAPARSSSAARGAIRRAGFEPRERPDPRRHRRLAPERRGAADAEPLRRRAQLPLGPGVGVGAGHGLGRGRRGAARGGVGRARVSRGEFGELIAATGELTVAPRPRTAVRPAAAAGRDGRQLCRLGGSAAPAVRLPAPADA